MRFELIQISDSVRSRHAGAAAGALTAIFTAVRQADCDRIKADDTTARVITLDLKGTRGVVKFPAPHSETYLNPDSQFAHQGQQGAEW